MNLQRAGVVSLTATTLAFAATQAASAAPPRQLEPLALEQLQRLEPTRVRGVRLLSLDPIRIEPTSPWYDYASPAGRSGALYCFDAYEGSGGRKCGGAPVNGPECGLPGDGYRWYFGSSYAAPLYVNDMTVAPGCEGVLATCADVAFHSSEFGPISYYLFTAETFDDTCQGPPYSGAYPGVQIDFNIPGPGGRYLNIDVGPWSLGWQMPLDGSGAYIGIIGRDDGQGGVIPACAQPFYWGTGEDESVPDGRVGTQGPIQWEDFSTSCGPKNAPDGQFDPGCECLDLTSGLCPDPLGAMVGFGADLSFDCWLDCDGSGTPTMGDFACFRDAFLAGEPYADCDANGTLTITDYTCFRNAFMAGCP